MYHPPDVFDPVLGLLDDATNEYVEIYNITTNTVYLYDTNGFYFDATYALTNTIGEHYWADGRTNTWRLNGMINFILPTNVHLAPGECLLFVNFDPAIPEQSAAFRNRYGIASTVQIFGPYGGGKLKNGGGSVEIYKPDPPQPPDHPDFKFVPFILVDRVNFNDKLPWPPTTNSPFIPFNLIGPDGGGLGLQRIVPERYGNEPTNWVAALPSPGSQPLHIDSSERTGSSLTMTFRGLAGSSYSLQSAPTLTGSSWTKVTSFSSQPSSGMNQVTMTVGTSNRFYRLVSPAQ